MVEKENKKIEKGHGRSSKELNISNFGGLIGIFLIGVVGQLYFGLETWIWAPLGVVFVFMLLKLIVPEGVYSAIKSVFLWILLGGVIIYLVFFGRAMYQTGAWKGGIVEVEEAGVDKAITKTGARWYDYLANPQLLFYEYYTWDQPQDVEDKPTRGVIFSDVETRRDEFQEKSMITVYGSAKITALPDEDVTVEFGCRMDDKNLNKSIKNKNYNKEGRLTLRGVEGQVINVYAGREENIDFVCELDGVELDLTQGSTTDEEKRNDKVKDIRTFVVKIEATYKDFETTSLLKIYNIQKEKLDQMVDPFEGVAEPLLDSNRKMTSQCLSGCGLTKLALKTSKQPQTEIGSYSLTMGLRKEKDWYGDILKVNEIQVSLPKNFEMVACENFGGDNVLDDSDQPYFDELNKDIKKKYGTTSDYTFYCDYKILRPRVFVGFDEISVITKYDYLIDKKKTVNVIETMASEESVQNMGKSTTSGDNYEGYEEGQDYEV